MIKVTKLEEKCPFGGEPDVDYIPTDKLDFWIDMRDEKAGEPLQTHGVWMTHGEFRSLQREFDEYLQKSELAPHLREWIGATLKQIIRMRIGEV